MRNTFENYDEYGYEHDKPFEVRQLEKKVENVQEFFIALYEELTSKDKLNLHVIYSHMSEIAGYLDIDESQFSDLNIYRN